MEKSKTNQRAFRDQFTARNSQDNKLLTKLEGIFHKLHKSWCTCSTWWMAVKFDDVFCSDPSTGLQFSVTQTSQQCSTTGWIMVTSPQSNCFYEKGLQKPSFFYSMTNTAVNWGSGNVLCRGILHVKGKAYRIQLSAVRLLKNETFFWI